MLWGAFKAGPMEGSKPLHALWASVVNPGTLKMLKTLQWAMGTGLVIQLHVLLLLPGVRLDQSGLYSVLKWVR